MTSRIEVDMTGVEEVKRDFFKGYEALDPVMLHALSIACLSALRKVDWNEFNNQRYGRKVVLADEVVFIPDLPPCPKPFRSWPEAFELLFGGLQGQLYEPKEYKLKYITEHIYQPDSIDPNNDRLIYEIKGVIPTQADARKYREVAARNRVHFIFVFQEKSIEMPFSRPRNNGTRMTHEEWCKKEGFTYTYVGEVETFKESDEYKKLLEWGKEYGPLSDQLSN